jgi:DNA-directed RNA polymerase subunit RPC12/RpoP
MFIVLVGESENYITDILVKSLRDDVRKDTLWRLFGDIIYGNITRNLDGTKICSKCGERFNISSNADRNIYCEKCKRENELKKKRKYWNKTN